MTEFLNYPAWRFHKSGVTAVIYSEEEDSDLRGEWLGYLPEGFVIPKDATYHGIDKIPVELKKSKTLTLPKAKHGNHNRA